MRRVLTFDFGASSGRAIIGTYENGKLDMKEVHRFTNDPVFSPFGNMPKRIKEFCKKQVSQFPKQTVKFAYVFTRALL